MNTLLQNLLSSRASRITWSSIELVSKKVKGREDIINFASGAPDPNLAPLDDLRKVLTKIVEEYGYNALEYPGTGGLRELRREIREYLVELGVDTSGREVIITAGAQHSLNILANMLLDEKDSFIVENPTFIEAFITLRYYTPRYHAVGVDDKGMKVEELEVAIREDAVKPKLVYTMPTAHNPTGIVMNSERRKQLVETCSSNHIVVIEDDPYRPIIEEKPVPIVNLDKNEIAFYVGSFSKIIAPGLRVGYILAPREIAEKIEQIQQLDFASNTLAMYILLELFQLKTPYKIRSRLVKTYTERLRLLLDLLEDHMPPNTEWTKPKGGFYVLLRARGVNMVKLLDNALRENIAYVPAQLFYVEKPDPSTARLSISRVDEKHIEEGVRKLARIIKQYS